MVPPIYVRSSSWVQAPGTLEKRVVEPLVRLQSLPLKCQAMLTRGVAVVELVEVVIITIA
jgi:hypothetical protein